jgi:hypothetical protein
MPAEADAVVELSDDVVDLVTCDPGPDADLLDGEGRSRDTISVIAARSTLAGGVLTSGGTNEQARCFSRGFIASLDYELIIADDATPEQQGEIERLRGARRSAISGCRGCRAQRRPRPPGR